MSIDFNNRNIQNAVKNAIKTHEKKLRNLSKNIELHLLLMKKLKISHFIN